MPRNQRHVPRADREAAILRQAQDLFIANGYRSTSVADVARAAGVAGAAVHWYFPTKDDLFAAVLDSIFTTGIEAVNAAQGSARDRLVDILAKNLEIRGLHRDAYERINGSDAVRAIYLKVQGWLNQLLLEAVNAQLPEQAAFEPLANFAQVLFEGMLVSVRELDQAVDEFIDLLIEALVAVAIARAAATPS